MLRASNPTDGDVLRVLIAGTRGTAPLTGPPADPFGGDTTCVLITGASGEQVILDCGTGLPALAPRLGPGPRLLVLVTHYHFDHLAGLGPFTALYDAAARITFAAPPLAGVTVAQAVRGLLGPPYWPLAVDKMAAEIEFRDLPSPCREPLTEGGLAVRWTAVPHPGGCTAYRIDEPATGAAVVLATDVEWTDAPAALRDDFLDLCRKPRPADLLIHDGQFDAADYAQRRGWGHATADDAVQIAKATGVQHLLITHHDPAHDGAALAARERRIRALWPRAALARQGQQIILGEATL
jgi:ribonuclease BN (tRNA processing enzyme)